MGGEVNNLQEMLHYLEEMLHYLEEVLHYLKQVLHYLREFPALSSRRDRLPPGVSGLSSTQDTLPPGLDTVSHREARIWRTGAGEIRMSAYADP